jgi:hypothetical protein
MMQERIRYYYLLGTATRVNDKGEETSFLSLTEYHDFVLNQKERMVKVDHSHNFKYDEYAPSKTPVIQSNPEQEAAARQYDSDSLVCMSYKKETATEPWTWVVEMVVDTLREADKWWEEQPGMARVYYGTGAIRNAK